MVYLDYAAATPVDERVLRAMMPYFTDKFYNPSAPYLAATQVRQDVERARSELARCIGARSAEVVMTAGATESVNLALNGVSGKVITLATEHPAVLNAVQAGGGVILPVRSDGRVELKQLAESIDDEVGLVSVGYVNGETGVVQPLKDIATVIDQVRADRQKRSVAQPIRLHSDASQAAGLLDLNVARLGVDLLTLNAAKCYGPKQVGLLYIRAGVKLKPLIIGGGQEMGLRGGTENVAGIIGFAKALVLAEEHRHSEVGRLGQLRQSLKQSLMKHLAGIRFNESDNNSPAILNISLAGVDGERVVFALDELGVQVATGSACAANKGRRSHVLLAMGRSEAEVDGSLRLSLGRPTTEDDVVQASELIVRAVSEQSKFGVVGYGT